MMYFMCNDQRIRFLGTKKRTHWQWSLMNSTKTHTHTQTHKIHSLNVWNIICLKSHYFDIFADNTKQTTKKVSTESIQFEMHMTVISYIITQLYTNEYTKIAYIEQRIICWLHLQLLEAIVGIDFSKVFNQWSALFPRERESCSSNYFISVVDINEPGLIVYVYVFST